MSDWLRLIRAEYHEIPDLQLTTCEAQRLWNLDAGLCQSLLHTLEAEGFLRRLRGERFVKA